MRPFAGGDPGSRRRWSPWSSFAFPHWRPAATRDAPACCSTAPTRLLGRSTSRPRAHESAKSRIQQGPWHRAARFQTDNRDVFPLTPTANPRAQLVTPLPVKARCAVLGKLRGIDLPRNFPLARSRHGWIGARQSGLRRAIAGSPRLALAIVDGHFRFQRNGFALPSVADRLASGRSPSVSWIRFTWHVLLSQSGLRPALDEQSARPARRRSDDVGPPCPCRSSTRQTSAGHGVPAALGLLQAQRVPAGHRFISGTSASRRRKPGRRPLRARC